jgi:hypothetical protein
LHIQKRFNSVKNPPQQTFPFSFLYIIYTDLDQQKINYDDEKEIPFTDKFYKVLA